MMVPETDRTAEFARYFFAALGNGAIGFSPFGMDEVEDADAPMHGDPAFMEQLSSLYQAVGTDGSRDRAAQL